jgi:CHAT domain-containing protein
VKDVRSAVEVLGRILVALGEESGTSYRDFAWEAWSLGAEAASAADDTASLAYFLESGRAGRLMEALGERHALAEAKVPERLRKAETDAQAKVVEAQAELRTATASGARERIRAAHRAWEEAQRGHVEAIQSIRRAAGNAADVLYPEPDSLSAIQGRLASDEALVLYGYMSVEALALVVTRGEARTVRLGPVEAIETGAAALYAHADRHVDPQAADRLRELVVAPLAIPAGVRRVLVSPVGTLAYAPAALLWPDREVAYVPSGTVLGRLGASVPAKKEKVLALGDPDYEGRVAVPPGAPRERGDVLLPLPASKAEAESVGDVVLLGKDATAERLWAALGRQPQWRAVHLACHGFVDPENPAYSSLALTATATDDGFLTAAEIGRARVPAHLVVLSACRTARGRIYRAEGVAGLMRAFMLAGARRVLVSLWPVDDAATGALMTRFYERWRAGSSPSKALREAQEFVSEKESWRHPDFWAAWILWGPGR